MEYGHSVVDIVIINHSVIVRGRGQREGTQLL